MLHRLVLVILFALSLSAAQARETIPFNEGWKFSRYGAMPNGTMTAEPSGLERSALDDSAWRTLRLPHDWAIEGPFRMALPNRTGKLPWVGIGWYRKRFDVDVSDKGQHFYLNIDGAMANAKVWLNDQYIGQWPYGYTSFQLELTKAIRFDRPNQLAIRLDNPADSSRWYPGGGIYRNVWLVKTAPVHVARGGIQITTPRISSRTAAVRVACEIEGAADSIKHQILRDGRLVTESEAVQGKVAELNVDQPALWDLETPNLYVLRTSVSSGGKVVDSIETTFGIRSIDYHAKKGFLLNGKRVQHRGVCLHHDLGPLGTAVNVRAMQRQIEIMQEMGVNAIRTSHNPPAPEFVQLCDRMGMMLQVEAFDCWKTGKTDNDYGQYFEQWHERDLVNMVKLYRNSPSVMMWSTGNEIREQGNKAGHAISRMLTQIIKGHDRTRPVTAGCNNQSAGFNGFQKTVDVFGFNYKPHLYSDFSEKNPMQPFYGSETASCVSSRGEYFFPVSDEKDQGFFLFQVSSYDLYAPRWASRPDIEFEGQDRNPAVIGEYVWTGFDYIGEPTPYNNDETNLLNFQSEQERRRIQESMTKLGNRAPSRSSYFGIVDLCGFKKDRFYLYQSRWRPELPMAHILPHWNWPDRVGKVTPVHVYTSGDEAELFLNGKSLGRKRKDVYEYRLRWDETVYQPGKLKVVAYKRGEKWAEKTVKTTGDAAKVQLVADRESIAADGEDLCFVTVKIVDAENLTVPSTNNSVRFKINGPGEIIAVGNGDPTNHESFQSLDRKVFNGLALVVVRSKKGESGRVTLAAESSGLTTATLGIATKLLSHR